MAPRRLIEAIAFFAAIAATEAMAVPSHTTVFNDIVVN
jgi:hypothetical protein